MSLFKYAFLRNYVFLLKKNLAKISCVCIFALETMATSLSLVAILVLGLIVKSFTDGSTALNSLAMPSYLAERLSSQNGLLVLVLIYAAALGLAAILQFCSYKVIRKASRSAYLKNLNSHLRNFERVGASNLRLSENGASGFKSSFTLDCHITFMAFDGILRAIRPLVYIVIYALFLVIIDTVLAVSIFFIGALALSIYSLLGRNTMRSAKSVFGEDRKGVYRSIAESVRNLDLMQGAKIGVEKSFYQESKMTSMLDSFDSWKLSSDKINLYLSLMKVLLLVLCVVVFVAFNFSLEELDVSLLSVIALAILKLLSMISNFFTRLSGMVKLFPVVDRFLTVRKEVAKSASETTREESKPSVPLLKWVWIAGASSLSKSNVYALEQQLNLERGLSPLIGKNYGKIGKLNLKDLEFEKILRYRLSLNTPFSDSSLSVVLTKLKVSPEDIAEMSSVSSYRFWRATDEEARVLVNLIAFNLMDDVPYIICPESKIHIVDKLLSQRELTLNKPMLTFLKRTPPPMPESCHAILSIDQVASGAGEEDQIFDF